MSVKHESTTHDVERASPLALHGLARLCLRHWKLVASFSAAGLVAGALLLALQEPVYRATATLLLDDEKPGSGVLADLALLARPATAASEIELLTSRGIAERALAAPHDQSLATPRDPRAVRELGLATIVDDAGRRPLAGLVPGTSKAPPPDESDARLFARVEITEPGAPDEIEVEVLAHDRVRLSVASTFTALGASGSDASEATITAGSPIDFRGARVWLETRGDVAGRSFLVRARSSTKALEELAKRVRAAETARNSGVIEVSVDDSDPFRAAEIANALCGAYLDRDVQRGERRASQTLRFIDAQLDEQRSSLERAEKEVADLSAAHPRTIDVGATAEALVQRGADLEVERAELALARTSLAEALERLDAGETEALSRLGPELGDPVSQAYVEEIASLRAQAALSGRADAGPHRVLLATKRAELEVEALALDVEVTGLREALDAARNGSPGAHARLAGSEARGKSGDPLSAAYAVQLAASEAKLAQLAKDFTDEHPDVVETRREIAALRERLVAIGDSRLAGAAAQRAELATLLEGYDARLAQAPAEDRATLETGLAEIEGRLRDHLHGRRAGFEARELDLARASADLDVALGALPEEERLLADPKRRLAAHAQIVKFLLEKQQEAQIARASTVASAEFIDTAVPPRKRHGPSLPLWLLGGLVLGCGFGLAVAFVRQSVDAGILTAAELEEATGLPVFGAIPDFRAGRYRVATASDEFLALRDEPDGAIAEAYRSLRANLKFALAADETMKVIAFTSTSQGEGKSVTNIDVALAFALGEKRVCLVDADMRRPSVHRYLGVDLAPGLSDVLEGRARWSECVREIELGNLHVISAGKQARSPGDLLTSRACDELIAELRAHYDLVVFDVPPALAVADTEGFASKLDATVLLCRSRKLTRAVIERTCERLRGAGANLIGCVLNADRPNRKEQRYGYGYGYGYVDRDSRTSKRGRRALERTGARD